MTEQECGSAPPRRDFIFLGCQRGHDWESIGGANCGCKDGACSVPVYQCRVCRDCDYGENEEAREARKLCGEHREIEKERGDG